MNVPGIVQSALGDEEVAAHIPLGGDDVLYLSPTRTLVYHGEGLLSDESVEEFPHDAERIEVESGRRKAKIRLLYGLDGERAFAVPPKKLDEALHPVLAGVLNAAGVTGPGETVTRTYRFRELTLVVTSERVVKHVGEAVWDEEFEEIRYEDVTGVTVEEGSVASQLVIDTTGRPQRIKTPNQELRDVRERVMEALLAYYDVASYEEFEALVAAGDEDEVSAEPDQAPDTTFESDLDPISVSVHEDERAEDATASTADATADTRATDAPDAASANATAAAGGVSSPPSDDDATPTAEASSESAGAARERPDAAASDADETAAVEADDATTGDGFEEFETAVTEPTDLEESLLALQETVERQRELLADQQALIEAMAAELHEE